jgi:predicted TIM-barrel fold metal-dependent hydrolase
MSAPVAARRIDVEAHFFDASYLAALEARTEPPRSEPGETAIRVWSEPSLPDLSHVRGRAVDERLLDVGERRIRLMDEAGVDVQVLSLSNPSCEQHPPGEGARVARASNDQLARLIGEFPERFVGLAALCPDPEHPEVAADELDRCVSDLGFRGWKVSAHIRDTYLDDPRYRPILARAAELGVPVCLHPAVPHASLARPFLGYGWALTTVGGGFGVGAMVLALRLANCGVFDELPDLKVVLGHLGEGAFFWLDRIDSDFQQGWLGERPRLAKAPSEYLLEHFYVSTSGRFKTSAFLATLLEVGADRMLWASDYPYEELAPAVELLESMPLARGDREKIFGANAARLFGI